MTNVSGDKELMRRGTRHFSYQNFHLIYNTHFTTYNYEIP